MREVYSKGIGLLWSDAVIQLHIGFKYSFKFFFSLKKRKTDFEGFRTAPGQKTIVKPLSISGSMPNFIESQKGNKNHIQFLRRNFDTTKSVHGFRNSPFICF